jgi:hypothetical protein
VPDTVVDGSPCEAQFTIEHPIPSHASGDTEASGLSSPPPPGFPQPTLMMMKLNTEPTSDDPRIHIAPNVTSKPQTTSTDVG